MVVLAAPPTDVHFPSREALLAHVRNFVAKQGYAVVIHKTNEPRGRLWLRCDLGGTRRRARLHDCPFQLYGRRLPSGEWTLKVQNEMHHHEVEPPVLQLVARRLGPEHKRLVRELTDQGLLPARILERLKEQFPGIVFTVQEIYNERNFMCRERLAGRPAFAGDEEEVDVQQQQTETMASAAVVPVMQDTGVDPTQVLQDAWGRVNSLFANWQPQVQRSFTQQLEYLMETSSKQNEVLNGGAEPTAASSEDGVTVSSEAVPAELGDLPKARKRLRTHFSGGT
ncbi:hypothetical protein PRIC2_011622 [Phytophthora ramorum]